VGFAKGWLALFAAKFSDFRHDGLQRVLGDPIARQEKANPRTGFMIDQTDASAVTLDFVGIAQPSEVISPTSMFSADVPIFWMVPAIKLLVIVRSRLGTSSKRSNCVSVPRR